MAAETHKSAKVLLQLVTNGTTLSVSHVGNGFLIARGDCQLPPETDAELRITVDGALRTKQIFLPQGISGPGQRANWY